MDDKQAQISDNTNSNQPQKSNDNAAIVSAISSMSDLLVASLSSLKTTMTDSLAEMHDTLGQFTVEEVADLSDIEALDSGETSRKQPCIDSVGLAQQSGAAERNEQLMAVPQSDIDELINQNSRQPGEGTSTQTACNDIQVLSGIANDLKLEQKKAPAINAQLAKIVQSLMREKLDDEVLTETKKRFLVPENCKCLTTTKVNHLIWDQLKPETRSLDVKLQKVQAHIVKGVTPIVKIIQALLQAKDKIPNEALNVEDLLKAGTDAIALFGAANYELNMRRRDSIKHELNDDYRHLCSPTVPFTEFLFGDDVELSKQLKDLTEATKVGKKLAKHNYRPDYTRQKNYKPGQKRPYPFGNKTVPQRTYPANKSLNWKRPGLQYSKERVEGRRQNK